MRFCIKDSHVEPLTFRALSSYVNSNMTVDRTGGWTGFDAPPGELIKVLENISNESKRRSRVASMMNFIESTDSISDSAKQSILGRNQER